MFQVKFKPSHTYRTTIKRQISYCTKPKIVQITKQLILYKAGLVTYEGLRER